MTGLILLTLRELRARKVVVGLFVVATARLAHARARAPGRRRRRLARRHARLRQRRVVESPDGAPRRLARRRRLAATRATRLDRASRRLAADSARRSGAERTRQDGLDAPFRGANPLESLVFSAQAFVAGAAYWVGILLCLFATGGLVASLVEPGQADLLVAKPLSRSAVLAGRLAGVGRGHARARDLPPRGRLARHGRQDRHLEPALPARHPGRVGHVRRPLRRRDARERVERVGRRSRSSSRSGSSSRRSCSPSPASGPPSTRPCGRS